MPTLFVVAHPNGGCNVFSTDEAVNAHLHRYPGATVHMIGSERLYARPADEEAQDRPLPLLPAPDDEPSKAAPKKRAPKKKAELKKEGW